MASERKDHPTHRGDRACSPADAQPASGLTADVGEGEALNDGVLDPAEPGHPTPEGLERKRQGPLNKTSGRRPDPDAA